MIPRPLRFLPVLALLSGAFAGGAFAQDIAAPGAPCEPPAARCPANDATCAGIVSEQGNVTEPKTGRRFFLDYACGLRPGDTAIFILNVHGIGGNANWQRHYFPALDYKDRYKLIVATGKSAGTNFVAAEDDEYVLGMIDYVAQAFKDLDIRFWVAGHSAGGGYSRSFMCRPSALSSRVVGSVSLAGNRVGGAGSGFPAEAAAQLAGRGGGAAAAGAPGRAGGAPPGAGRGGALPPGAGRGGALPPGAGRGGGAPGRGGGGPGGAPSCGQFSHIYSTGDIDSLGGNPVPATSTLATALGCGERVKRPDIVDTRGGHVYDARDRPAPLPGWGGPARPGTTEYFEFPGCRDGRVVADLIRLGKGHTEGLEPLVTEEIVKLMVRASQAWRPSGG